ncbi:undecaprenyl-diphosphate phosphatase [Phocicoccus pinnipedialis]|uniref:Undecaprenyl-diphosphatase n=1 Tax=Phocicoccus pinnipedialis TaxID=110845 RepID=A0A6V7R7A5_9BACL|nr:undecaprenyl-diphosphate phosphatase [Jeotgalicoccus pinnipedialis]MBP1938909.1 undecaprenyl-diphosphatase [Jeotgalicoccus pinnipedialis]CAD2073251.1 Undecaprenyl-diphosphatase [Jeotgalicoccus pinnipedialis]
MDIIEILKYIFLGLLQGITEAIPVSSSGHLVIAREMLGLEAKGLSFEMLLNTASLIAILYIYWKDIVEIATHFLRFLGGARDAKAKEEFKYVMYLVIATIPVGVTGLLLKDVVGDNVTVGFIGAMLLVTGIALWIIKSKEGIKQDGELTLKDSIIIGLAQSIAIIPGISRSGSTLVGAMSRGLHQKNALRFVFLLYIPVSLGTALLSVNDLFTDPDMATLWFPYLLAFISSLIMTYYGFKILKGLMENSKLEYFSYYCFALGTFSIIYQIFWA